MSRECHVVYVRPELVVEIAFNDVQQSPRYPGGVALRFARVKRYRPDKPAADADTIDAVREIYLRRLAGDSRSGIREPGSGIRDSRTEDRRLGRGPRTGGRGLETED